MEEKEIFKSFNGVDYSEEEINEYIDLGNMTNDELSNISGAVRTKLGINNIKKGNEIVKKQLEDGEEVRSIIKIRNIKVLKALTVSSAVGGTLGTSMDYGVFNTMYFTDKRIFFVDSNVANQPLMHRYKNLEDIVSIEFTNKIVRLKKDENGELKIKLCRSKFKIFSIVYPILVILLDLLIYYFNLNSGDIPCLEELNLAAIPLGLFAISKSIQDIFLDRIKIILDDGYVWDILIASYDYKECREYLSKLARRLKQKRES